MRISRLGKYLVLVVSRQLGGVDVFTGAELSCPNVMLCAASPSVARRLGLAGHGVPC